MRIWLDLPDALGDRVAAPGQDLSEAAFHALVIDTYRMGRLTEHELREVLDLPTRDAVDGFLKAHGVPLDYSVEDLAEEWALAVRRAWPGVHPPTAIVTAAHPDLPLSPTAPRRPGAAAPSPRTARPVSTRFRVAPR